MAIPQNNIAKISARERVIGVKERGILKDIANKYTAYRLNNTMGQDLTIMGTLSYEEYQKRS